MHYSCVGGLEKDVDRWTEGLAFLDSWTTLTSPSSTPSSSTSWSPPLSSRAYPFDNNLSEKIKERIIKDLLFVFAYLYSRICVFSVGNKDWSAAFLQVWLTMYLLRLLSAHNLSFFVTRIAQFAFSSTASNATTFTDRLWRCQYWSQAFNTGGYFSIFVAEITQSKIASKTNWQKPILGFKEAKPNCIIKPIEFLQHTPSDDLKRKLRPT